MEVQAKVLYKQRKLEDAKLEISGALEIFERLGATEWAEHCQDFLRLIEKSMKSRSTSFQR
jgi:hypothetical protein